MDSSNYLKMPYDNAFNTQQDFALGDYLEASVMIRYNSAKR
jgi:hypothetical protein